MCVAKVGQLIANGTWKRDIIQVLFCRRDQEMITSIALNPTGGMDSIIWHCTKNGHYSVSSAYRLSKVVWQLCHNSLATQRNLYKRGIREETNCPRCRWVMEDDLHIFFYCDCDYAPMVWKSAKFWPFKIMDKVQFLLQFFKMRMVYKRRKKCWRDASSACGLFGEQGMTWFSMVYLIDRQT